MIKFISDQVACEQNEHLLALHLGQSDGPSVKYITIQLAVEPDQQDVRLGLDGIYLEINDQSCSGYDAISEFRLVDEVFLQIAVQPQCAEMLGSDCIQVRFSDGVEKAMHMVSTIADSAGIPFQAENA